MASGFFCSLLKVAHPQPQSPRSDRLGSPLKGTSLGSLALRWRGHLSGHPGHACVFFAGPAAMAHYKVEQDDWLTVYLKYLLFVFNFFFWVSAPVTLPPPSALSESSHLCCFVSHHSGVDFFLFQRPLRGKFCLLESKCVPLLLRGNERFNPQVGVGSVMASERRMLGLACVPASSACGVHSAFPAITRGPRSWREMPRPLITASLCLKPICLL